MNAVLRIKENKTLNDSFTTEIVSSLCTSREYHYHEDLELVYNIQDRGIRCIGDNIEKTNSNELILIGQKVPHFYHNDEEYFSDNPNFRKKVLVIHFKEDIFNKSTCFPELKDLNNLLKRADHGIQILGPDARAIGDKMMLLTKLTGWRRLLSLVEILSMINEAKEFRLLSSTSFSISHKMGNEEKISRIFNVMVENHNHDFTLEDAASLANLSISGFCRYFKKHTTKTFSQLLNEIRIGFACKSLIYTENSISEIAFSSGYNSVPYFNRLFKKFKKTTPKEFRENHHQHMLV